MGRLIYSLALCLGLLAASPYLVARTARGRYRDIALARLGLGSAWLPRPGRPGGIWVHALSVGEVGSALPLVRELRRRHPERPLVFSAATAQGLAVAREALAGAEDVTVMVRPLDVPWAVGRLIRRLRPGLAILVEGDIWPGWQWGLGRAGVPRLLVNGRVSPGTFRGYRRLGGLARALLAGFERILVQTPIDAERLLAVGVPLARVAVAGNLKFDSAPPPLDAGQRQALAREWSLAGRPVLVAGSTHEGEEEPCLDALAELGGDFPGLALVLAPREVARGAALERLARARGLSAARVSQGPVPQGCQVVILDVLGRLAEAYALGRAAFVGGSFTPIGGHNLLEPAAQGVPVLFGPVTHNFQQMARDLVAAGGGLRLERPADLAPAWRELLARPDRAASMGRAAQAFCGAHRGALARVLDEAERLLGARP